MLMVFVKQSKHPCPNLNGDGAKLYWSLPIFFMDETIHSCPHANTILGTPSW